MTPLDEVFGRLAHPKGPGGSGDSIRISGLAGSSKAYFLSRLPTAGKKVVVYLAPTTKEAAKIQADLHFFGQTFDLFPPHDVLPFTNLSPHLDVSCQRMALLDRLTSDGLARIVTTPSALLPLLPPPSLFQGAVTLKRGEETDRDLLVRQLAEWGYQKVILVSDRGTFAVRGSLIDLFPPSAEKPLRLEWLGDFLESIRAFDPKTQRSQDAAHEVRLVPVREVVLGQSPIRSFQEKIRTRAERDDIPQARWKPLAEKVKSGIFFSGIETYLPLFYETVASFWDYLNDPLWVIDDWASLRAGIGDYRREVETIASGGKSLLKTDEVLLPSGLFFEKLKCRSIELGVLSGPETILFPVETHEEVRREIDRKSVEPLAPLAKRIHRWLETDRVVLVASNETQAGRLRDLLDRYFAPSFPFEIAVGTLSSGFRFPGEKITYLTDEEIFGPRVHRPDRASPVEADLSALSQIKVGDPLVHKQHGIGIYRGMIHMRIEGTENDFLLVEYRGGDKLYLPVYRMNLVQRFLGADGPPRIDRLGGTAWLQLRKKAEKAIRQMAGELLNLYAARAMGKGFTFTPPNEMFETFEAGFPFEETPDQEKAIADTLADMQKAKPMDRLILGDVGYGKTEVAMRAAFKAALDGKQTALLVPTTLLAFQHFERFSERFRGTPVLLDMISRFRSAAEQKQILKTLAAGKIDILIGTHRLLQPDVSFKNLGLLVIDEEHRFGVSHKEKIKRLRKNVDVLTLSATPIPRTLYMSLTGIREISVIETPPTDRLAIRTYVMPFQEGVIREAIVREIKRGGQVFFIHNRVESIGRMQEFLQKLIPEATIEIAHGQMKEEDLEEIMLRFYRQKFNVLLCTTIVESGIDISTANTILIDHADRLGLAQIYQLRGRVGRGGHRAFAYLLVPEEKELTPEAVGRLQVLQKFSELGSGFRMASYDLEIRGSGNLLGKEQSGRMASIGYELYTELLEKAVRELKGEKVLDEIDPELHFKLPAFILESYIPDPPLRLELYRRLSSLDTEDEVEPIASELVDRFGKLPTEVENLLELSAIKTYAKKLRLKQIRYDGRNFSYAFDPTSPLPPEILTERIKKDPKKMKLTPEMRLIVEKPLPENLVLMETKKFLRELADKVSSLDTLSL